MRVFFSIFNNSFLSDCTMRELRGKAKKIGIKPHDMAFFEVIRNIPDAADILCREMLSYNVFVKLIQI